MLKKTTYYLPLRSQNTSSKTTMCNWKSNRILYIHGHWENKVNDSKIKTYKNLAWQKCLVIVIFSVRLWPKYQLVWEYQLLIFLLSTDISTTRHEYCSKDWSSHESIAIGRRKHGQVLSSGISWYLL